MSLPSPRLKYPRQELRQSWISQAMIQDLKADSSRWEQERRSTSRSAGGSAGGTKFLSKVNGVNVPARSNTPAAQSSRDPPKYHTSETHHNRQYYGPTSAADAAQGGYSDAMAVDSYPSAPPPANPVRPYPGTGNSGYYGVNSNSNPPDAQSYGAQVGGYNPPPQPSYSGYGYSVQHAPTPDRYGNPAAAVPPSQGLDAYVSTGANRVATDYPPEYPPSMIGPGSAPSRSQGYPQQGFSSQDPSTYYAANYAQPIDAFYGRGQGGAYNKGTPTAASNPASDDLASPAGTQPASTTYNAVPEPQQQYPGQAPPPPQPSSRTPNPAPSATDTQMANSTTPVGAPRRDDTRERTERSHREREDRHERRDRQHNRHHR